MNTLNTICTALTAVFSVFLLLFTAAIAYVLFRWGRGISGNGHTESSGGDSLNRKPKKELLYFFCWKNQTARIEPDSAKTAEIPATAPPLTADSELDELMMQHALYGPSRVLFTIREEEREDMEAAESRCSSSSKKSRCVSLDEVVAVTVTVDPVVIELDDSTPFTTPCTSPPFYTPPPSPPRTGR